MITSLPPTYIAISGRPALCRCGCSAALLRSDRLQIPYKPAAWGLTMTDAQLDNLLHQLLAEGLLDEQFSQLMQLQDDSNPHFVAEVRAFAPSYLLISGTLSQRTLDSLIHRATCFDLLTASPFNTDRSQHTSDALSRHIFSQVAELYFEDSGTKLEKLNAHLASLGPPDFNAVDQVVHQFKGSSASFGAQQIAQLCVYLRDACQRQDRERCQQLLVQVKQQFEVHTPFNPTTVSAHDCVLPTIRLCQKQPHSNMLCCIILSHTGCINCASYHHAADQHKNEASLADPHMPALCTIRWNLQRSDGVNQ